MGKGGGGSPQPTSQTVTQTNLPEYAKPYFENILGRAQAESYRPYTAYQGERISGFTPGQQAVQAETVGKHTPGQLGAATGLTGMGGLGSLGAGQQYFGMATDPTQMQTFMSPYQQAVTDVAKRGAIREAQMAQQQANLGAARQGTYGGARQAILESQREAGLRTQMGDIQAQGLQSAFDQAQNLRQRTAEQNLASALGVQQLGAGQSLEAQRTNQSIGSQATLVQVEMTFISHCSKLGCLPVSFSRYL